MNLQVWRNIIFFYDLKEFKVKKNVGDICDLRNLCGMKYINGVFWSFYREGRTLGLKLPLYVFEQADDFEWHSAGLGLNKVLFAGLFYPDSKPAINWKLIAWDMK